MGIGSAWAVSVTVAVTAVLVLVEVPAATWLSTGTLSLVAGAGALALMAVAALLSARLRWIEAPFGGLDRMYRVHKWLGVWALVLASLHMLFKPAGPGWEMAAILSLPPPWTRFVRQLSYVGLVSILVLALNRNIRYSVWRWWHKLSGPLFAVAVLHWLSIKAPVPLASPGGVWLAALSAAGLAGALYRLLGYPVLAPHAICRVLEVQSGPSAVRLRLQPEGRALDFVPGQFGFLSVQADGLREPHPFTFASAPRGQGGVEFVVRTLGDYTRRLAARVRAGMTAKVYGPYGCFLRPAGAGREAWIAGGVGIAPFLAWLDDPSGRPLEGVTLFYFHTPGRDFPSADEVGALARSRGAQFVAIADGPGSAGFRQHFHALARQADGPPGLSVSFCGPPGLLGTVRAAMQGEGVPGRNLQHELCEFR